MKCYRTEISRTFNRRNLADPRWPSLIVIPIWRKNLLAPSDGEPLCLILLPNSGRTRWRYGGIFFPSSRDLRVEASFSVVERMRDFVNTGSFVWTNVSRICSSRVAEIGEFFEYLWNVNWKWNWIVLSIVFFFSWSHQELTSSYWLSGGVQQMESSTFAFSSWSWS